MSSPLPNYDPAARRNNEVLYSPHTQKNSFINKPAKVPFYATMDNFNSVQSPRKLDSLPQDDRMERIRRILAGKESTEAKL